jgi:hypothetical protein
VVGEVLLRRAAMGTIYFWLWANGFLFVLDIFALVMLILYLTVHVSKFTWAEHGVSAAVLIYITGHMIKRGIEWDFWDAIENEKSAEYIQAVLDLLHTLPNVMSVLLSAVGLIIIIVILAKRVRWLSYVSVGISAAAATVATWLSRS